MTRYGYALARTIAVDGTRSVYAVKGMRQDDRGRQRLYLRYVGRVSHDRTEFFPDTGNIAGAIWLPASAYEPFTLPF